MKYLVGYSRFCSHNNEVMDHFVDLVGNIYFAPDAPKYLVGKKEADQAWISAIKAVAFYDSVDAFYVRTPFVRRIS